MSSKSKKLSALADIYGREHLDGAITRLKISNIKPAAEQPRQDRTFKIDELAQSIERDGLLNPIQVCKNKDGRTYRIIAGERRYHAVQKLGWSEVECRIISRSDSDYWRIAIIENLQRENLDAGEEARAFLQLKKLDSLSDAELASQLGKSRNYITEILGINQMPADVLDRCQTAGLENKNMLIQASQAWKRGTIDLFLEAWRNGGIQTVRDAKQFNQGTDRKAPRATTGPRQKLEPVTVHRTTVTIRCPDEAQAERLALMAREWIKQQQAP
ncbi:MAG: ParB/RepB/Spo0J family partition protein [Leptospiraceae bacterium]|nr:ParB/RepB/Spo0J family partition protein [Leptospiraceae bacterium]